jgi:hypothetical protein
VKFVVVGEPHIVPHDRHKSLRSEGITFLGAQINFYPYFPHVLSECGEMRHECCYICVNFVRIILRNAVRFVWA